MAAKKRSKQDFGKDRKKKIGKRIGAAERCVCLCHNPATRHFVLHFSPCCGSCRYCGARRIGVFILDSHLKHCREAATKGGAR